MPTDSYPYLRKAVQIAEEVGDIKSIGYNCSWLAQVCADLGLLDEAVLYGERAREAANRFESDPYLFRVAFLYSAYAHFFRGDVKKCAEYGQALLDYGRKHSDLRCITCHYFGFGESYITAGDYPSAIEIFKKCVQVSPDPVMSLSAQNMLGRCYLAIGQLKEAQSTVEDVIEHSEKFGFEWMGATAQATKAMVLIAQGDLKQGIGLLESLMRVWLESKSLYRYAMGSYFMGRVYSKIAPQKAEEYFNMVIKTAGKMGAKSYLGQAYLELGKLHKSKGRTEKARECISNAIDAFEKCEADVFLRQAREALADLG